MFLFNPFWSPTIDKFAENLSHSLSESPRDLYVVYVNPFCELVFDRQPTLAPMFGVRNYYRIYRSRLGQMFTPVSREVKYGEQVDESLSVKLSH